MDDGPAEPTNPFDGHIENDDGTKDFADGTGRVGGVNTRSQLSQLRSKGRVNGIDDLDEASEPTNPFDGHLDNDDGTKDFADGAGRVGGVNMWAQTKSKKGDNPLDRNHIPNNNFDGLYHHDDGSKSFVDGYGKVGGVNEHNDYAQIRKL